MKHVSLLSVPLTQLGTPDYDAAAAVAPVVRVPPGHVAVQVTFSSCAPFAKNREFVVVDRCYRALRSGGVYAIQWHKGDRPAISVCRWTKAFGHLAWWIRAPGGGLTDGPYRAEQLRQAIVGRVVGVLADPAGNHLRTLWGFGPRPPGDQPHLRDDDLPGQYVITCVGDCLAPVSIPAPGCTLPGWSGRGLAMMLRSTASLSSWSPARRKLW